MAAGADSHTEPSPAPTPTHILVQEQSSVHAQSSAWGVALAGPGDRAAGAAVRGSLPPSSPAACKGKAARHSLPSPGTTRSGRGKCRWFSGTRPRSRRSPARRCPAGHRGLRPARGHGRGGPLRKPPAWVRKGPCCHGAALVTGTARLWEHLLPSLEHGGLGRAGSPCPQRI